MGRRSTVRRRPSTRVAGGALAALTALAGCGADAPSDWNPAGADPRPPAPTLIAATGPGDPSPDDPVPAGLRSDVAAGDGLGALRASSFRPIGDVDVAVERVGASESAVDLAFRPGDELPHVVEHAGRIVRLEDGAVVADLRNRLVGHRNEQGLTGLEFSADGGTAWIHYTRPNGHTTISEVPIGADGRFDLDGERPLIELRDPPGNNHNAGDLLLAADGTLLVTLGDGEAAIRTAEGNTPTDDPHRVAHDPTTLRGSILRVRPTPGGPLPYEIPEDNPFADGPLVAADGRRVDGAPEVLAWGLRNPWKIDLDEVTGSLWVADVGSHAAEEVSAVAPADGRPAGWAVDFGWSGSEGTEPRNADVVPVLADPVDPVFAYPHDEGRCAISGGVVYRGEAVPELWSAYVFADFCQGSVWAFDLTSAEAVRLVDGIPGISGVRAGPDGELWVSSWFGEVVRLVPT